MKYLIILYISFSIQVFDGFSLMSKLFFEWIKPIKSSLYETIPKYSYNNSIIICLKADINNRIHNWL